MTIDAIILNKLDNVATALRDIKEGENVKIGLADAETGRKLSETISYGHKFALKKIKIKENIIKYGEIIGCATEEINAGMHVHVHNIESLRGRGDIQSGE